MQDKMTVLMIIGCILKNPLILIDDNFRITTEDFGERFHKIVFSAINNLVISGAKSLDPIDIDTYLSTYDKQYKIFNDNNGFDYLNECISLSELSNFEYYYKRFKKFSLLKNMKAIGIDVSDIYDEEIIDVTLKEQMVEKFEQMSIDDIIDNIEHKVIKLRQEFTQSDIPQAQAGKGLESLIESFQEMPEMGLPLQSKVLNTIVRGARLRKLYMRSSITGGGKSRLSVADACGFSIPYIFDLEKKRWKKTGFSEPTLLIVTETELDEIQTMIVAFVSGVEEWKILENKCEKDEMKRVKKAVKYIEESPLWLVQLADFNIEMIESTIKEHKIKHRVQYVFFDYLFTSVKMLSDIAQKTKGMKLREDNVLYLYAEKLKHLCNKLGIFIFTATQLNGDYKDAKEADQNLLRGSKAIADKLDAGIILLPVTKKDLDALRPVLQHGFLKEPNYCYHIYKNRRGKYVRIRLWVDINLGNCRTTDCFVTTNDYELINVDATNIERILEEHESDIEDEQDFVKDVEEHTEKKELPVSFTF